MTIILMHSFFNQKTFNKQQALQVGIDQFAITSIYHDFPIIGSFGAGQCIILAVHCPEKKQALLIHIMSIHDDDEKKIARLDTILSTLASRNTVAYLTGGYNKGTVSKTTHKNINILLKKHHISIKLNDVFHSATAEPKSCALDARTGCYYSPVDETHFATETFAVHYHEAPFGDFLKINANKDASNGHGVDKQPEESPCICIIA